MQVLQSLILKLFESIVFRTTFKFAHSYAADQESIQMNLNVFFYKKRSLDHRDNTLKITVVIGIHMSPLFGHQSQNYEPASFESLL